MSKRLSELERQAKRLQLEIEAEKRQINENEGYFSLLDEDLENWRLKLVKEALPCNNDSTQPMKWKLVFFSKDWTELNSLGHPSYGPSISQPGWSSKLWYQTEQKCGGSVIAYAMTPEALIPPPLAMKRLTIFGFVFVICPVDRELPKSTCELASRFGGCPHFTFGHSALLFPDKFTPSPLFGIEEPDLTNLEHIDILYQYSIYKARDIIDEIDTEISRSEKKFNKEQERLNREKVNALEILSLRQQ